VNLPDSLKQRGVHNVFHASLLRIHIPNDDHLFPGHRNEQIPELGGSNGEWMINRILTHRGSNTDLEFKVEWSSGDQTWVPHLDLEGSTALGEYLKFLGVKDVSDPREDLQNQQSGKETMKRPGVPVASANTFIRCPCPSCHLLSSLAPSTRCKSNHYKLPSPSINLDSQYSPISFNISLFTMNPLPDPCIRPSGPLWFIVHVSRLNGVEIYGMHWEQVRSFFEYDNSLRQHLHTLMPYGYLEFRHAYELDHPNSTTQFADPGFPALNENTTPQMPENIWALVALSRRNNQPVLAVWEKDDLRRINKPF